MTLYFLLDKLHEIPDYSCDENRGDEVAQNMLRCNQDGGYVLIKWNLCHLEYGHCIVTDHIGATEGLGKEQEYQQNYWQEDTSTEQF